MMGGGSSFVDRTKQKTPSTDDNFSAKNNKSIDLMNDYFDIDDNLYGSNTNNRR